MSELFTYVFPAQKCLRHLRTELLAKAAPQTKDRHLDRTFRRTEAAGDLGDRRQG